MNGRRWRGALIGCGFFAPNQLHAWASIPQVEIVAVCDRDRGRAQATGRAFGVAAVYEDAAVMLDREQVDFIDIVTTTESHRVLVELGAKYGKLIVCQKPFADCLSDADAMVAACEEARVPLLVHENFRWQRPFQEIAQRLREGAIGRPQFLRLSFRHHYDIYRDQPYLSEIDRLALMDVGLHLFDLARVLLGDVRYVDCRTQHLNPAVRGEDAFVATLQHESSAITVVDCSFYSKRQPDLFPQTLALIEGSNGSIELAPGYRLIESRDQSVATVDVEPDVPSWGSKPWHAIQDSVLNFQRHVVEVLDGRATPAPSGAHNRETLALVLAAYESAERLQSVRMARPGIVE